MKVRYFVGRSSVPLPSLGGATTRHRPIIVIRASSLSGDVVRDALVDTGADDTVFPESMASQLGVDLTNAPQIAIHLAGRGFVSCRYARVKLLLSDWISETYEWEAIVGFVAVPMQMPLLGHASCLEYFDATFLGADHEMILLSNRSFPGRRI